MSWIVRFFGFWKRLVAGPVEGRLPSSQLNPYCLEYVSPDVLREQVALISTPAKWPELSSVSPNQFSASFHGVDGAEAPRVSQGACAKVVRI